MGCDINAFIEYKKIGFDRWLPFGGKLRLERNYDVFGKMAGVRNSEKVIYEPRGYPSDLAFEADDKLYLFITDELEEGEICYTKETGLKWIAQGMPCKYDSNNEPYRVLDPDTHHHSWLTPSEFFNCLKGGDFHSLACYFAAWQAMSCLIINGFDCRIVFWFDN